MRKLNIEKLGTDMFERERLDGKKLDKGKSDRECLGGDQPDKGKPDRGKSANGCCGADDLYVRWQWSGAQEFGTDRNDRSRGNFDRDLAFVVECVFSRFGLAKRFLEGWFRAS